MTTYQQYTRPLLQEQELDRQEAIPNALNDWCAKHPGACHQCGSHDGMQEWDRAFLGKPPLAGEQWYRREGLDDALFTPCPYCKTDLAWYEPMTHAEVVAWMEGE